MTDVRPHEVALDRWPEGAPTFVFTDIVGSTSLVSALGDRYLPLLADHNALLRATWSAHGGIAVKTEGDSFFVAFAEPGDAIRACIAGQRALLCHAWPDRLHLHARMGIHRGEATRVGRDYHGLGVIIAARVANAAHGDQILVTAETLVGAPLDEGVVTRDLGTHGLKGVPAAPVLLQIEAPDLPSVFPPPATLRATRSTIPASPAPLRGREAVLPIAHDLLLGEARVVSIIGTGGIGKTRFAVEVARDLIAYTHGGVLWVECAPLETTDAFIAAIADAVGVELSADARSIDQIAGAICEPTLLLLDNLEHLAGAPQVVADLVSASPHVKILATSRHRLRIRAEHALALDPLQTPGEETTSLADVERTPAAAMFLDRARAADLGRTWTDADAVLVGEIARALDGVPLALELAAARMGELELPEILAGLARAHEILAEGDIDLPARQRSMTAAIGWSIDLLDDASRETLAAASVFRGGAARDALDAVLGRSADTRALVRASLVRLTGDRILMLEPVRAAAEELAADVVRFRQAHTVWFEDLAERSWTYLTGHHLAEWLARLRPESANLDVALRRADPVRALKMAAHLGRWWARGGHAREGAERIAEVLARAPEDAAARAHASLSLGNLQRQLGHTDDALAALEEAIGLAGAAGDHEIELLARIQLSEVARLLGERARAVRILTDAAKHARTMHMPSFEARIDLNLGLVVRPDDPRRAVALLNAASDAFAVLGDEYNRMLTATNRAWFLAEDGDVGEADRVLIDLLDRRDLLGDDHLSGQISLNAGWVAMLAGETGRAEDLTRDAVSRFAAVHDLPSQLRALTNLTTILSSTGREEQALEVSRRALILRGGDTSLSPDLVPAAVFLALALNEPAVALEILLDATEDLERGPYAAALTVFLATAQAGLGNIDGARASIIASRLRAGADTVTEELLAPARESLGDDVIDAVWGTSG